MTGRPSVDVVGTGVVGPSGVGVPALWQAVLDERMSLGRVPYDTRLGDDLLCGVVPGSAPEDWREPGRLVSLAQTAAEAALASIDIEARAGTVLILATTDTGGNALSRALDAYEPRPDIFPWSTTATLARRLGLSSAHYTVGNASASGAVALGVGRDLLLARVADSVLVVGADVLSESAIHGLVSLRTLNRAGCRPFSSERNGIRVSEGAAAILLQADRTAEAGTMSRAGRLVGYGDSGLTSHLAAPESAGIALALERALGDAGISPSDVVFINTHGPGTIRGDEAEAEALRRVFGGALRGIPITSSKGSLGHWQGAAGVVESLVCILSNQHLVVTPATGSRPIDPRFSFLDIVTEPRAISASGPSVSVSCGLGGVNTAVVWGPP